MTKYITSAFLLLLTYFNPFPSHASSITLTDVSVERGWSGGYWGVRIESSWATVPSYNPDGVIPPCSRTCTFGLMRRYLDTLNKRIYIYPINYLTGAKVIEVTPGMTWAQANDAFIAKFGSTGAFVEQNTIYPSFQEFCVGALSTPMRGELFLESPSSCTINPQVPVTCTVTGTVEIDHGVLNPSQMAGHTATATGRLSCSRAATMRVRVIPPTVDLGGGWMSTLQIDGVGDGGTITTSGSSDLSFVSRLSGSSTTTGPLTGTSIVILDAE